MTNRFTSWTASVETAMRPVIAKNQYRQSPGSNPPKESSTTDVESSVSNMMGPR